MLFAANFLRFSLLATISTVVAGEAVPPPLEDTPSVPDESSPEVEVIKRFLMPNPEDIVIDPSETFFITGTRDGYVRRVDIETGNYELIYTPRDFSPESFVNSTDDEIRELCDASDPTLESTCGGVLGIKIEMDATGTIYRSLWMANAYYGIFEGTCRPPYILERRISIEGGFVNNLQPLGRYMYYTLSHSTKQRNQLAYVVLDDTAPGGSLHRLDTFNNYKMEEVASDMYFANGLAASTDGLSLYVSETTAARIRRYDVESGELEPFLDDIPVLTDNIFVRDGELLVPGYTRNDTMEGLMLDLIELEEFLLQGSEVVVPAFRAMVASHGNLLIYDEATGDLKERIFQAKGGKFSSASSVHKLGDGYLVGSSFFPGATWFRVLPSDDDDDATGEEEEDATEEEEDVPLSAAHIGGTMFLAAMGATATLWIAF